MEEVQPLQTTQGLSTSTDSKHRKSGFDPIWLKNFSWLQKTNEDDDSDSGMLCKLWRKHNQRAKRVRQRCVIWVDVLCFNYKQVALKEQEKTNHHNVAVNMEAQRGLTAVVISNELKDIRRSSKDDFKHNVYNKYLPNVCKHVKDGFPVSNRLEAFSVIDSTTWAI